MKRRGDHRPRVLVVVEGGLVSAVFGSAPVVVRVVDHDKCSDVISITWAESVGADGGKAWRKASREARQACAVARRAAIAAGVDVS